MHLIMYWLKHNYDDFQPHLVEKAIIVDVSPATTSPSLKSMGEIFTAMRRVSLPNDIDLPQARIMADEQIKMYIPDKVTRSFILMNLYRAVNGAWVKSNCINALKNYCPLMNLF